MMSESHTEMVARGGFGIIERSHRSFVCCGCTIQPRVLDLT
jgi:hypothetical protein